MRGLNRAMLLSRALRSNFTAVSSATANLQRAIPHGTITVRGNNPNVNGFRYVFSSMSLAYNAQTKAFNPEELVLFRLSGSSTLCRNKVEGFLDYYRIPFKVDEGDTWSDDKKKPIVALDGELMFDSSDIIDKLIKRIHPDYDINAEEEKKWREWVDNHLEHVVLANLYRNVPEQLKTMDWNTTIGNVNSFDRFVVKYSVIVRYYFRLKKLKKEYNITDERAALYGAVEQWVDALKGRQFLGGLNPNLADLAVFAILLPILNGQIGRDVIEQTRIRKWRLEMHRAYDEMELRYP